MPSILIIEKNCDIKTLKLKTFVEEDLYKKCNFKSAQGFSKKAVWQVLAAPQPLHTIELYGKTEGRANHENKYEFPPPADNTLFFGSCILVKRNANGEVVDITTQDWEKYYSQFHGGFEDIGGTESSCSSDDGENAADDVSLTKEGYEKDDFVVDDDEPIAAEEAVESAAPAKRGRKKGSVSTAPKKARKPRKTAAEIAAEVDAATVDDNAGGASIYDDEPELSEEEYV